MAGQKITEKAQVATVKPAASVLITQKETVDGVEKESLRRAPISALAEAMQGSLTPEIVGIKCGTEMPTTATLAPGEIYLKLSDS